MWSFSWYATNRFGHLNKKKSSPCFGLNSCTTSKTLTQITGMHSSRMHIVRCSSHLGGGCLPARWGCLPAQGGVWLPGGICLLGEGGVCLPARGCLPASQRVYTFPCGQTDTCENIIFPQLLLRTVIKQWLSSNGKARKIWSKVDHIRRHQLHWENPLCTTERQYPWT